MFSFFILPAISSVKFHGHWLYLQGSLLIPNPSLLALVDESQPGGAWGQVSGHSSHTTGRFYGEIKKTNSCLPIGNQPKKHVDNSPFHG